MDIKKKEARYQRIYKQLEKLMTTCKDEEARKASILAVLHHKMDYFFWTGFYMLNNGELIVSKYQGPVACMLLKKGSGVCWASINQQNTIVVADVHSFPGHIACDSRSESEVVVPLKSKTGEIVGVLDVDSKELNSFDDIDRLYLEKILNLIYI
ncbi:MAG: GAF domain-containing protein [Bacteroidales bacterium]|jgi:L-methionine (R)-S-oxide reductase|nr:GAF domain-containing protein [Bacteroidales bacterium]